MMQEALRTSSQFPDLKSRILVRVQEFTNLIVSELKQKSTNESSGFNRQFIHTVDPSETISLRSEIQSEKNYARNSFLRSEHFESNRQSKRSLNHTQKPPDKTEMTSFEKMKLETDRNTHKNRREAEQVSKGFQ